MSRETPYGRTSWAGGHADDCLESWKDIAGYFKRDVRTIQRWEKSLGLPIHRFQNSRSGPVFAYKSELEAWLLRRTQQLDAVFAMRDAPKSPQQSPLEDKSPDPALIEAEAGDAVSESTVSKHSSEGEAVGSRARQIKKLLSGRFPHFWPRPRYDSLLIVVFMAIGGVVAWASLKTTPPFEIGLLRSRPLTSQLGLEAAPALSPDGQWIAYVWTPNPASPGQLYVRRIDGKKSLPLRAVDIKTHSLAWSPDSKRIAYLRSDTAGGSSIYSISRNGDGTRKEVDRFTSMGESGIDWSPDGRLFAYTSVASTNRPPSIYIFDKATAEKRKLTSPPALAGDNDPKFSPDGRTVSFKRVQSAGVEDIFLIPTKGGTERPLTRDAHEINGQVWTRDSRSLIISSRRMGFHPALWQIPIDPKFEPRQITDGSVRAIAPSTSRNSSQLAWVTQREDSGIWQVSTRESAIPKKMIASTMLDENPQFSPAGLIAFGSDRSGTPEIWISKVGGSDPVQVTSFNGPVSGAPRWSPDGLHLAFDSRASGNAHIYVATCDPISMNCSKPSSITRGSSDEVNPSWSSDGAFVYYASDVSGDWQLWKQPFAGGAPAQLTHNGGLAAVESNDGKWIYFCKQEASAEIWRMPGPKHIHRSPSIPDELLIDSIPSKLVLNWALSHNEIFFARSEGNSSHEESSIWAYNIASKQSRRIICLNEHPMQPGMSVSADSQLLMYSQLDSLESNIVVTDSAHN